MRRLFRHSSYWQKEKRKLDQLSFGQKISYILEYYWLWIAGLVLALFLLIYIPYRAFFTIKDYWFYAVFANTMEDAGSGSALWQDYSAYSGSDLTEKAILMNAASYFDPTKRGGTNNSYFQSFVAVTEAGDLDVVTIGTDALVELGRSGRLIDLRDDKVSAIYEKYQDRILWCEPYDTEYAIEAASESASEAVSEPASGSAADGSEIPLVPVGIDISDSLLVTKYHVYEGDCALGIGAYTTRPEAVANFLAFILPDG